MHWDMREFESLDSVKYQKIYGTEERFKRNPRKPPEFANLEFDLELVDTKIG